MFDAGIGDVPARLVRPGTHGQAAKMCDLVDQAVVLAKARSGAVEYA